MTDPNDPEGQEPQAPEAEPQPAPVPQIDLEQAYDVIAQREGWDPRLTRYEIQEHKRRVQDFERQKKEWESQNARRYEPPDDGGDPYMRRISSLERVIMEEREERKREREENDRVNRISHELQSSYIAQARQAGLTPEQMNSLQQDFYATVTDMYPDSKMIQDVGAERAARNAFGLLNRNGNGRPRMTTTTSDRRASVFIPGNAPSVPAAPPLDDGGAQRPGESIEEYVLRRRAYREKNPIPREALQEGVRYSSE